MFDKSTVQRNDLMVVQFVVLFLTRAIFRETSTGLDVKTVNVIVKKQIDNSFPSSVLLSTKILQSQRKISNRSVLNAFTASLLRKIPVKDRTPNLGLL